MTNRVKDMDSTNPACVPGLLSEHRVYSIDFTTPVESVFVFPSQY